MADDQKNRGVTLWNCGPGGPSALDGFQWPADLDEIIRRTITDELRAKIAERVKPYKTPVTLATLRYPVK